MKKIRIFALASFLLTVSVAAAAPYGFSHGPYLQELTPTGVTFVFTTSDKGFSWVELRSPEGEITRHYAVKDGLRDAYNTFCTIRTDSLRPATAYDYRLCSKRIDDFQPYRVTFGDSIVSRWYAFRTPDPRSEECSFVALSDMHGDSAKLARLLALAGVESADRIFYVGDMMNYYDDEAVPFRGFIDKSVELFASERPFVLVRGNHETRGNKAREYARYAPSTNGTFYGAFREGDVMFVVLDCGEDKPDDFPVYAGLNDFDSYRSEQARWFAELIRSKEYRTARWHVVMNHFPPVSRMKPDHPERHGVQQITDEFLPLFNRASIDLMVSGHTHRYELIQPTEEKLRVPMIVDAPEKPFDAPPSAGDILFPVMFIGTGTVVRVDVSGRTMRVRALDLQGKTLAEFELRK